MYGPTLFAPMLKLFKETTSVNKERMYYVLLILTDGCIHDMRETVDQIVECSNQPISIIIVGVGNADFTVMEMLDCDDHDLVNGYGISASRDIVQFVRMNDFKQEGSEDQSQLAEAVLAELPDQLVGYMHDNNIKIGEVFGKSSNDETREPH